MRVGRKARKDRGCGRSRQIGWRACAERGTFGSAVWRAPAAERAELTAIVIGKAKLSSTSGTGVTEGESEAVLVLVGVCVCVAVGDCVAEGDKDTVDVGEREAVIETVLVGELVTEGVGEGEADAGVMHVLVAAS